MSDNASDQSQFLRQHLERLLKSQRSFLDNYSDNLRAIPSRLLHLNLGNNHFNIHVMCVKTSVLHHTSGTYYVPSPKLFSLCKVYDAKTLDLTDGTFLIHYLNGSRSWVDKTRWVHYKYFRPVSDTAKVLYSCLDNWDWPYKREWEKGKSMLDAREMYGK